MISFNVTAIKRRLSAPLGPLKLWFYQRQLLTSLPFDVTSFNTILILTFVIYSVGNFRF